MGVKSMGATICILPSHASTKTSRTWKFGVFQCDNYAMFGVHILGKWKPTWSHETSFGLVKFKVSVICATTWQKPFCDKWSSPMFKKRISQQSTGPSLEKKQTTSLSQNHSQAMKLRHELIFKSNVLGAIVRTGDWCNPSYPIHWLLSSSLQWTTQD